VKPGFLQNFIALDGEAFGALMRHLGFAAAACYRCGEKGLFEILSTEPKDLSPWPAAVARVQDPTHYTTVEGIDAKLGWQRADTPQSSRKTWPKSAYLYFPEQGLEAVKIVFAVLNPSGKRSRSGEMSAPLEALASRIRAIIGESQARQELSEAGIAEHIRSLGLDLSALIDHELRTPLASVAGYAALLREPNAAQDAASWNDYWKVVESQTACALEAVDKLSLALHVRARGFEIGEVEPLDADEELRALCKQAKERSPELIGSQLAERVNLRYLRSTDRACIVRANRRLFRWALWEVLKNAIAHSRYGKIEVAAFTSERMLVIDVEDDGAGVPPGAEDIIFLRFYQDPNALPQRRAKRGLGLGLFLARQIVERHLGTLVVLRAKGRGAIFRFMWPMPDETSNTDPGEGWRQGA
jgi:signal transduction histidine kinase